MAALPGRGGGPTPPAAKPQLPEAAAQKHTLIIEKREGGTAASRWQGRIGPQNALPWNRKVSPSDIKLS
jgi:hypothetical protein